jgi:putative flippase GtrA
MDHAPSPSSAEPNAGLSPWRKRLRYMAANAIGAGVDLAVALLVNASFDLPLWMAASLGVVAGSVVNYFAHEFWTFGQGGRFSSKRLAAYLGACLLVLGVRAGLSASLKAAAVPGLGDAAILIIAFAASFLINYAIAGRLFRRG